MVFLIEYNRPEGRVVSMQRFEDAELSCAYDAQLELELALLHRGIAHEVVILQAASEEQLRRMNMRYFCSPEEIGEALFGEIGRRLACLRRIEN
ncbi:MAG: hypothetical protein IT365_14535 [Candidatus Hydrogenedentes bacterium]|nr:hypothetical protein [Candidatus Hydrogenedentota bacterium]